MEQHRFCFTGEVLVQVLRGAGLRLAVRERGANLRHRVWPTIFVNANDTGLIGALGIHCVVRININNQRNLPGALLRSMLTNSDAVSVGLGPPALIENGVGSPAVPRSRHGPHYFDLFQ